MLSSVMRRWQEALLSLATGSNGRSLFRLIFPGVSAGPTGSYRPALIFAKESLIIDNTSRR